MSKPTRIKPDHGGRGPAPQKFPRWVHAAAKRGAKAFRVKQHDGEVKTLAHRSSPDSTKRIEALQPERVEALDDKDRIIGEWQFASDETAAGDGAEPEPGYLKDDEDTDDERTMKTFAHLIADAHRVAMRNLVEVVNVQSRYFAEERRNLLQLQLAHERLQRRFRITPRLRVAEGEGAAEGEGGGDEHEETTSLVELLQDPFVRDLVGPYLKRLAGSHAADHAAVNGEAPKAEKKA